MPAIYTIKYVFFADREYALVAVFGTVLRHFLPFLTSGFRDLFVRERFFVSSPHHFLDSSLRILGTLAVLVHHALAESVELDDTCGVVRILSQTNRGTSASISSRRRQPHRLEYSTPLQNSFCRPHACKPCTGRPGGSMLRRRSTANGLSPL